MQHFTKVGGNGERLVDDHVSFIGINARMSGSPGLGHDFVGKQSKDASSFC